VLLAQQARDLAASDEATSTLASTSPSRSSHAM